MVMYVKDRVYEKNVKRKQKGERMLKGRRSFYIIFTYATFYAF